jgi:hypothetical protein
VTTLLFGCPRSGTSILGELFEHVPGYQFYFEPSMTAVKRLDHDTWEWALKNPIGPKPWTPGLACDLDELRGSVPHPMSVFIVRHPLDVICSMRPSMETELRHGPTPPDAEELTDPLDRGMAVWNWVNGPGYTVIKERRDVHLVKFEDLVREPVEESLKILNHVGRFPTADSIKQYTSLLSNRTGGYEAKHQDKWVTQDHELRIGRWRSQLSEEEVSRCWPQVSEIAREFGYKI